MTESLGTFEIFELDPYFIVKDKKLKTNPELNLFARERDFLFKCIREKRASLIILLDKRSRVKIFLSGLVNRLSVLVSFLPESPLSENDLYCLQNLRDTVCVSPDAEEKILHELSRELDFHDRISRLLNLNAYIMRGSESRRCSHELVGEASTFAENLAFLCGAGLLINREYPDVIYPEGFDCSAFGLLLIAALGGRGPASRLAFISEDDKLFAEIILPCDIGEVSRSAFGFAERFNIPMSVEREIDKTRVLFAPMRPDFSLLGLKQPPAISAEAEKKEIFLEYD